MTISRTTFGSRGPEADEGALKYSKNIGAILYSGMPAGDRSRDVTVADATKLSGYHACLPGEAHGLGWLSMKLHNMHG